MREEESSRGEQRRGERRGERSGECDWARTGVGGVHKRLDRPAVVLPQHGPKHHCAALKR